MTTPPIVQPAARAAPRSVPRGVVLLGALHLVVGVIALFVGGLAWAVGGPGEGAVVAGLAVLMIAVGFSLFALRPWAWWFAVGTAALAIVANVAFVALGEGPDVVSVVLNLIILLYLLAVKQHFRAA